MTANRIDIAVRWGDCDPANIVFYPNYFSWFDLASYCLFSAVGLSLDVMHETYGIVGLPIVDAGASFLLPSKHGDVLTVESHVASWSRKSLRVEHKMFKETGEVAITGHEVRIWAKRHDEDQTRLKTHPIPQEVKSLFG